MNIKQTSTRLIILDRDGVINQDSDDYIKSPTELICYDSSIKAIKLLTEAGFSVVVATNQSGIARNYFTLSTLDDIHQKMYSAVENNGGKIQALEFCPDHPDQAGFDRKPSPGMPLKLLEQFNAVAEDTWFVGDSISDILCAQNALCKPALVLTGKGQTTLLSCDLNKDVPVFNNLLAFTKKLLFVN